MSPFQALFRQLQPSLIMGDLHEASVVGVEQLLADMNEALAKIKNNLELSKQRMKELTKTYE